MTSGWRSRGILCAPFEFCYNGGTTNSPDMIYMIARRYPAQPDSGNKASIDHSPPGRTRLDITLDEQIRDRIVIPSGLPPALGGQRAIVLEEEWLEIAGSRGSHMPI